LSINLTALPALVEFVGLKPILAQFIFSIFIIISSYFWHSYVTFSNSK
jgi:putative flippase GtrA